MRLLIFAALVFGFVSPLRADGPVVLPVGPEGLLETLGVKVVALRQTAEGHMIDFRFKVLDTQKAQPFFEKENKIYLVDEASGKALDVPVPAKLGPMRPSTKNPPKEGVVYWIFFGNTGLIRSGSKVTVAVGDYRIQGLTVE